MRLLGARWLGLGTKNHLDCLDGSLIAAIGPVLSSPRRSYPLFPNSIVAPANAPMGGTLNEAPQA